MIYFYLNHQNAAFIGNIRQREAEALRDNGMNHRITCSITRIIAPSEPRAIYQVNCDPFSMAAAFTHVDEQRMNMITL